MRLVEHQGHATLVTNSFDEFILVQSTETPTLNLTLILLSWVREIKVLIVNHILQCFHSLQKWEWRERGHLFAVVEKRWGVCERVCWR